jgi:uncharacterized membrane protein
MTRRILIFALLGPALGSVVLAALTGGFPGFLASSDALVIVPGVFAVTLLPFLLCAAIDFLLEDAKWWERLAAAAIAGLVTSFIAARTTGAITQHVRTLQLGLIVAIPAMVCSWLAQQRRRRASEAWIEGGPEQVG